MPGCLLAKLCLGLSVITTIIYAVCFASPYWLQKDFSIRVPGFMINPNLPSPLNTSMIPVEVSSNMGLLASCDDVNVFLPGFPPRNSLDCGSDGARDWQYVAAGFGIAGLVLGVLSMGLSTAIVFLASRPFYNKLRVATVICYLLISVSILVPIILYATKKEFQVKPPLPDMVEYDLNWAIWVAVGSDVMYAVLMALHIVQIFTSPVNKELQKDAASSYRMDYKVPS